MYLKFHFYNTFATSEMGKLSNPLTHVLKRCKRHDFVVLKVDIDNNALEEELIRQLRDNPLLVELVDELFWEHHVTKSPIRKYWKQTVGKSTIADSYAIFHELRRNGIRAHSWV
mmetsp:Transcript_35979/g.68967  ORF Transcript_35979/g.68967 Transcript_35979/m.68967 type:complete len:114 (-) Transcript_35979:516-857(-)